MISFFKSDPLDDNKLIAEQLAILSNLSLQQGREKIWSFLIFSQAYCLQDYHGKYLFWPLRKQVSQVR